MGLFLKHQAVVSHDFAPTLSGDERQLVHWLAASLGLAHDSLGRR